MSTDDRDDRPEFPHHDGTPADGDAAAGGPERSNDLPDMPVWREGDHEPAAPRETASFDEARDRDTAATSVSDPDPLRADVHADADEAVASHDHSAAHADAGEPVTRSPIGGPYVVDEHGAPIAEQAREAYRGTPQGGPYVTSSEPISDDPEVPVHRAPEPPYDAAHRDTAVVDPTPAAAPRSSEPAEHLSAEREAAEREPAERDGAGSAAAAAAAVAAAGPAAAGAALADRGPRTPYPAAAFAPSAPTTPVDAGEYPLERTQTAPETVTTTTAPERPRPQGNRGAGTLIALLGTLAFAIVYAGVSFVIISATVLADQYLPAFLTFLASAAFLAPVAMFAIALILVVLIVNRAGWWAYVLGGFLVAVVVYFGAIAGAVAYAYITGAAAGWGAQDQYDFVAGLTLNPLTIAAAVVAREASIWTGAWIAARGRKVKARNAAARDDYSAAMEEHERRRTEAERTRAAVGEQPTTATAW